MERLSVTILGTALGLTLAAAGAPAAPVQIGWTEHFAALTPQLYAEGYHSATDHYVGIRTPFAQTIWSRAGRPVVVLAANLNAVSSNRGASRPDFVHADYTLSMLMTDEASNAWKILQFHGQVNGSFWRGGSSLGVRFLPVNPQFFSLGRNFYAVDFGSLMRVRGTTNQWALDVYIAAAPQSHWGHPAVTAAPLGGGTASPLDAGAPAAAPGGPAPQASPEPCTLLLAALGAAGLGGRALWQWRRTRRAVPPALA
jgi:hypothetical protein